MISVVIPAYNEEAAISDVVGQVASALEAAKYDPFEIVVVNDASNDKTAALASEAGARVISNLQNSGYGRSIKRGINAANYDTIVILDADGTYPSEDIPKLIELYGEGYDMIVGARQGAVYRESWYKFPLRIVLGKLVEFVCGRHIPDVNSGLRVFSKETITPVLTRLSNTFSFTTSLTLAYVISGKYVRYEKIEYRERIGESKVRLVQDSLRTMQFITQAILFHNPIKLFLLFSIFSLLLGVVFLIAGLTGASALGVEVFGIAVLLSLVLFGLGLVCDSFRQHFLQKTEE